MNEAIPANPKVIKEALELSETIRKDIEMGEIPLSGIALRTKRLADILKDTVYQKIFDYEVNGYPTTPDGINQDVWECAVIANRIYQKKDDKTSEVKNYAHIKSIEELEAILQVYRPANTWISHGIGFSNPIYTSSELDEMQKLLSNRKRFIYDYISQKYYELKFSYLAEDAFSRIRESVDKSIGSLVPMGDQRIKSIYKNLRSDNPEDWSMAVHGCRRVLTALADAAFPPQTEPRHKNVNGKEIKIKLGPDEYKNRLICFVEDHSNSERFKELVGSHLEFLENRLESVIEAANKGTHSIIISREEADRYVVYTYMIVGDILTLWKGKQHTLEN